MTSLKTETITAASWLTLSRLFLLPLAILPVILGWSNGWFVSAVITVIAGITDIFDGYVARRMGQITAIGTNLDFVTDKIFVVGLLTLLVFYQAIPIWIPVTVTVREITVSLVRFIRFRYQPPYPDKLGKTKTVISFIAIAATLLQQNLITTDTLLGVGSSPLLSSILSLSPWLMLVAVLLTIISGMNYLIIYSNALSPKKFTVNPQGYAKTKERADQSEPSGRR